MFGAIDAEMVVLAALMVALGIGPALLALSSHKTRTPCLAPPMPALRLSFGPATAARRRAQGMTG